MSRKGLTQVEQSKFVATAQKLGLNIVENKGWIKCYPAGKTRGIALGIPTTKAVTRIELVGFEHELGVAHPKPPAKTVTQMLDFSQPEKEILRAFYKVARHMASLVPAAHAEPAEAVPAAEQAEAASA